MKKQKKIWIPIVSVLLVIALGSGLAVYFTRKPGKTVSVYDINDMTIDYWGDNQTTSGPVTSDKLQTVFLSATQEVTKVNVQEGQKVTKGTTLLTYDTTLSQLSLDRKDLEIQKTKLRLEDAKDQLADIKKMKPISYSNNSSTKPTTKPTQTTTKPGTDKPSEELGEKSFLPLGGTGTSGDPRVLWVRQSQVFDDKFIAEILDGSQSMYTILEVRKGDKAAGTLVSRTGVYFEMKTETLTGSTPAATATAALQQEAESYGVHLLTDVAPDPSGDPREEPSSEPGTDPGTEPSTDPSTEPSTEPSTDPSTEPSTDPSTDPTDSTEPSEPDDPKPVTVIRYSFTFFQVSQTSGSTSTGTASSGSSSTGSSSSSGTGVNMNSGYTSNEIAQMRSDKEAEIKELQFAIKMAEAEYKIMKKEFDNGEVKSEVDGYVVSVLSPEEALTNNEPIVKVSGGGGFFIQGSVGELSRDDIEIGQTVQIFSWSNGTSCEGTITAIGDYPVNSYSWSSENNPTVSYYPFTVSIDESANLEAGSYAEITYGSSNREENGFYLDAAFIRTENGRSYVYVQNEEGLLEKRELQTGPTLWGGEYVKVYSGVDQSAYIAFPYGVEEGAPTEIGDLSDLYNYY